MHSIKTALLLAATAVQLADGDLPAILRNENTPKEPPKPVQTKKVERLDLDNTLLHFAANVVPTLLYANIKDLPKMFQGVVEDQREELRQLFSRHSKNTLLRHVMTAESAQLWLSTNDLIKDVVRHGAELVALAAHIEIVRVLTVDETLIEKLNNLSEQERALRKSWNAGDLIGDKLAELQFQSELLTFQIISLRELNVAHNNLSFVNDVYDRLPGELRKKVPLTESLRTTASIDELREVIMSGPKSAEEQSEWTDQIRKRREIIVKEVFRLCCELKVPPSPDLIDLQADRR